MSAEKLIEDGIRDRLLLSDRRHDNSAGAPPPVETSPGSTGDLDDQLSTSCRQFFTQRVEFLPAQRADSHLETLKSRYPPLNPKLPGDEKSAKGKKAKSVLDRGREKAGSTVPFPDDGIPRPRRVLFESKQLELRWKCSRAIGTGLFNLGNTCFLNSVLQTLMYTPPLFNFIMNDEHKQTCQVQGFCAVCELRRHCVRMLTASHTVRPMPIAQNLKAIGRNFRLGRQEDAHEFLRYFIDSLQKSVLNGCPSNLDSFSKATSVVHQIFGGYHRSQVKCLKCHETSDTYDPLLDLSLDIKNAVSILVALRRFVQPDVLDEENKYLCPHCKQMTCAEKRLTLHRVPKVLTLHLKRFDYGSGSMNGKILKHVKYPEFLDMRPFMSNPKGPSEWFRLYSVLVHFGFTCHSGHYYSFVKNSNGIWYNMNDGQVQQVSLKSALQQDAYMLFYINDGSVPSNTAGRTQTAKPAPAVKCKPDPNFLGVPVKRLTQNFSIPITKTNGYKAKLPATAPADTPSPRKNTPSPAKTTPVSPIATPASPQSSSSSEPRAFKSPTFVPRTISAPSVKKKTVAVVHKHSVPVAMEMATVETESVSELPSTVEMETVEEGGGEERGKNSPGKPLPTAGIEAATKDAALQSVCDARKSAPPTPDGRAPVLIGPRPLPKEARSEPLVSVRPTVSRSLDRFSVSSLLPRMTGVTERVRPVALVPPSVKLPPPVQNTSTSKQAGSESIGAETAGAETAGTEAVGSEKTGSETAVSKRTPPVTILATKEEGEKRGGVVRVSEGRKVSDAGSKVMTADADSTTSPDREGVAVANQWTVTPKQPPVSTPVTSPHNLTFDRTAHGWTVMPSPSSSTDFPTPTAFFRRASKHAKKRYRKRSDSVSHTDSEAFDSEEVFEGVKKSASHPTMSRPRTLTGSSNPADKPDRADRAGESHHEREYERRRRREREERQRSEVDRSGGRQSQGRWHSPERGRRRRRRDNDSSDSDQSVSPAPRQARRHRSRSPHKSRRPHKHSHPLPPQRYHYSEESSSGEDERGVGKSSKSSELLAHKSVSDKGSHPSRPLPSHPFPSHPNPSWRHHFSEDSSSGDDKRGVGKSSKSCESLPRKIVSDKASHLRRVQSHETFGSRGTDSRLSVSHAHDGKSSAHHKEGHTHKRDGSGHHKDSHTHKKAGAVHHKEGHTHKKAGTVHHKEGHAHKKDDSSHHKDGHSHKKDDFSHHKDGHAHKKDDSSHHKEGHGHKKDDSTHYKDSHTQSKDDKDAPNREMEGTCSKKHWHRHPSKKHGKERDKEDRERDNEGKKPSKWSCDLKEGRKSAPHPSAEEERTMSAPHPSGEEERAKRKRTSSHRSRSSSSESAVGDEQPRSKGTRLVGSSDVVGVAPTGEEPSSSAEGHVLQRRSSAPVVEWDASMTGWGSKQAGSTIGHARTTWDGSSTSPAVEMLVTQSHGRLGDSVRSWDGGENSVDSYNLGLKVPGGGGKRKRSRDVWDEELDRGKVKKSKKMSSKDDKIVVGSSHNPFQQYQNKKNKHHKDKSHLH